MNVTLSCIIYIQSERYGVLGACSQNCEKRLLASSCLSARNYSAHEILYLIIFRKSGEKIRVSVNSDKNNGYFTEDLVHFFIISRSFLLRLRNVSYKSCRENQNAHFMFGYFFFNRPVYEIM